MNYELLGIEEVDYENKMGRRVKGLKLHLTYQKKDVEGMCVETVFVSERIECNAQLGDIVRVVYNRFGSVTDVEVVA